MREDLELYRGPAYSASRQWTALVDWQGPVSVPVDPAFDVAGRVTCDDYQPRASWQLDSAPDPFNVSIDVPDAMPGIPDAWLADAVLLAKPSQIQLGEWSTYTVAATAISGPPWGSTVELTPFDQRALYSYYVGGLTAETTASKLRERGRNQSAQIASDVANHFLLAAAVQINDAVQPRHIKRILSSRSRLLRIILSIARRGLHHVRSLLALDVRTQCLVDSLESGHVLMLFSGEDALSHDPSDRAPGLEPQPSTDSPTRSRPRETRAGPEDEEPEQCDSGVVLCCDDVRCSDG